MAEHDAPRHSTSRYVAIADLFAALDELMSNYQSSSEDERMKRWSDDAERITGEVARHLAVARVRIAAVPRHDPDESGHYAKPRDADQRS
ncbi:hypothetical protein GCM10010464_75610 [Pseudonocardia yunnanensis]|uniref:Uncharacterized protein n=1 Tax=Pseudonocardia yunnanensis TaxID=58107 RepID=A0ABW4FAA2_9PSEU